jgi:lipopolysaccharide transport system ATP-binding protein
MKPSIRGTGLTKIYPASATGMLMDVALKHVLLGGATINLSRSAETPAVNDVNLTIRAGERLGIVGRNGAGKSTLLSLLARLAEPTSGSIVIEGHVTAVMTLGVGLREDLSGRENIYIDGEIQGKSRSEIDAVIDEIVAFADIGEFIDYPLRTYSTGMKARLAFSMIINIDPEILIIDEALSAGDAAFAVKAKGKIREICDRGKIVIIVAHSMASIVEMCNRCLWMDRGQIVMDGKPVDVTAAYIDTVRREDEVVLLDKFRRHHGAQSIVPGCSISRLELRCAGNDQARAIFTIGDAVSFRIGAELDRMNRSTDIALKITRFDGLTVCESSFREKIDSIALNATKSIDCEALLEPLFLGTGIYEIRVELRDGNELLAHRTTIFEIQIDAAQIGGKPALIYPCSLEATPLSQIMES